MRLRRVQGELGDAAEVFRHLMRYRVDAKDLKEYSRNGLARIQTAITTIKNVIEKLEDSN